MNVLFILYHGMACNSAHHVTSLAKRLSAQGDQCVVAVPDAHGTAGAGVDGALRIVTYHCLSHACELFPGDRSPDVVVAWTPRENVRLAVGAALQARSIPLVVHLEDNEDAITARYLGVGVESLRRLSFWKLRGIRGLALSHPRRLRRLLARADGVSMVLDRLQEFCPPGIPSAVFWPGYDEELFDVAPPPDVSRRELLRSHGVPDDATAIVYTGNIHRGNVDDMESLYHAVATLNARGLPTRLLRTGENHAAAFASRVAAALPHVVELGFRPRSELPALLSAADVLVQPGAPGVFNDYRFPSKLPEFLVSGRPVVMAKTNLGRFLRDGIDALVVRNGTMDELADAVARLRGDAGMAQSVGARGREFAHDKLQWDRAARTFRELLVEVVARAARARP